MSLPVSIFLILFMNAGFIRAYIPAIDNFITPQFASLCFATSLLVLPYVVTSALKGRFRAVKPGVSFYLFIIWLLSLCLSSCFSSNVPFSFYSLSLPLLYMFLFIIFLSDTSDGDDSSLRASMVVTIFAVLFSLHGISQYFGHDFLPPHSRYILSNEKSLHVFSIFGNSNHLAWFLAVAFPFSVSLFLSNIRKRSGILHAVFALLIFCAIVLTSSRSSIIASVVSALYLITINSRYFLEGKRKLFYFSIFAIIALSFAFNAIFQTYLSSPDKTGSTHLRVMYAKISAAMFRDRPFGSGYGTYYLRHNEYQKLFFSKDHDPKLEKMAGNEAPRHPHNEYLSQLVEGGFIAFIFFSLAILSAALPFSRGIKTRGFNPWNSTALSFMIISFFGFPLLVPSIGFLFPLILAGAARANSTFGARPVLELKLPTMLDSTLARRLICFIIILSIFLAASEAGNILIARLCLTNGRRALSDNNLKAAEESLSDSIRLNRFDGEAYTTLGVVKHRQGKYAEAMKYFDEAEKTSGNLGIEINRALLFEDSGNLPAAVKTIKEVIEISPGMSRARRILLRYYVQSGMYPEALKETDILIGMDGRKKALLDLRNQLDAAIRYRNGNSEK